MNISPNTKIVICQDVPLDNTYEHTIHFGYAREYQHLADQYNYFYSKRKYVFEPTTYQRVNSNTLRIQMIADNLYNCNYLMFQNTNFRTENTHYSGDKWFYAFITSVNYINNAVTEITYEIDVMQTWMFDYVISSAYVERQHAGTDAIGDNLIPEPIIPSNYVTSHEIAWPPIGDGSGNSYRKKTILITTGGPNNFVSRQTRTENVNGIACYVYYLLVDDAHTSYISDELNGYIQNGPEENVIAIMSCPPIIPTDSSTLTASVSVDYSRYNMYSGTFNGYTPKNNKMYTYPFNKLQVQNSFGQIKEYRFEHFQANATDGHISFRAYATALPKPAMVLYPVNYAGNESAVEDSISIGEYPNGCYTGDSFMMWLHHGLIQDIASVGSAGVSMAMGIGRGDDVGAFISGRNLISSTTNTIAHGIQAYMAKDNFYGNLDANSVFYGHPTGYTYKIKTLRPDYSQAKMIDDYFTRFGYAQNKIMTVDTYTRTHWTYTKTLDCTIVGSVPADDMAKIREVFNKGITWWINPSEIGNFTLDNQPRY